MALLHNGGGSLCVSFGGSGEREKGWAYGRRGLGTTID
jgi:hypothetical protein